MQLKRGVVKPMLPALTTSFSFPLSLHTGERRERVKGQDHPGNIYTVAPSRNDSFPFPSLCLSHSLAISHGNDRSIRHKSRGGGTIEI